MPRYRIKLSNGTTEEVQADSLEVTTDDDEQKGYRKGDLVLKGRQTERSSGHYRKGDWESYEQIPEA